MNAAELSSSRSFIPTEKFVPNTDLFCSLPKELILQIFSLLNFKDYLAVTRVCRNWRRIVKDPTTSWARNLQEVIALKCFSRLTPRFSPFLDMPKHWGLYTKENALKFSLVHRNLIAFHPHFCNQSSQFFSFTEQLPHFSNRLVFLASFGDIYFFTQQSKPNMELELPNDLNRYDSHVLIVMNRNDPSKTFQFSLLKNPSTRRLSSHQIRNCFPISETQIAILSEDGKVSFWDISSEKAKCYAEKRIDLKDQAYKLGNHLLTGNTIVNLRNHQVTEHRFNFEQKQIVSFSSALCAASEQELSYFVLNEEGFLEKKWEFNLKLLTAKLDPENGAFVRWYVENLNEEFIVLSIIQCRGITLHILNTKGDHVHSIVQKMKDVDLHFSPLDRYPMFVQLSGKLMVYKHPQNPTVYFWFLHSKECLQEIDLTKKVKFSSEEVIQNMCFVESKLTLLLSSGHIPLSNKPGKYRLVQFDSDYVKENIGSRLVNKVITSGLKTFRSILP